MHYSDWLFLTFFFYVIGDISFLCVTSQCMESISEFGKVVASLRFQLHVISGGLFTGKYGKYHTVVL